MGEELIAMAMIHQDCDLSDDALIYSESATWDRWINHVPTGVRMAWPEMSKAERAIAYLCCKSVTFYERMQKPS